MSRAERNFNKTLDKMEENIRILDGRTLDLNKRLQAIEAVLDRLEQAAKDTGETRTEGGIILLGK